MALEHKPLQQMRALEKIVQTAPMMVVAVVVAVEEVLVDLVAVYKMQELASVQV